MMQDDPKQQRLDGVKRAMENHHRKLLPKTGQQRKPPRKNSKPEEQLQKATTKLLRSMGFSIQVVESKAVYNPKKGRYLSGQTKSGTSDIYGCDPVGFGVFIEMKAPGKRSTVKQHQVEYLWDKIRRGAFGYVCDDNEKLKTDYSQWLRLRKKNKLAAINFLKRKLPISPSEFGC